MNGTLSASMLAAAIVVIVGLWASRRVTAGVPGRLQLTWETVICMVERRLGPEAAGTAAVPLALSLFGFLAAANTLRVVPGTSRWLPNPAADLNVTVALAAMTVLLVHGASIRRWGFAGYLRRYLQPYWWLAPLNLLEEAVRPLVLALRLFGSAFAGGLMIALVADLVPPPVAPLAHALWAVFDLAVGYMQAFIFALLALLYYEAAVSSREQSLPAMQTGTGSNS